MTPTKKSIRDLLQLKPTGLVMEPTGGWYSGFWHRVAEVHNIPVYWMAHAELKGQRSHFGFPNKYDENDSLCLAASYFDPYFINKDGSKRFLKGYRIKEIQAVRELVLELEQLDEIRTALVNQLRQRFALEYPEAAAQSWQVDKEGYTPIIKWLIGKNNHGKRVNHYNNSVANSLEIDISDYSINHASAIHDLERRRIETEGMLWDALEQDCFTPYRKAFSEFNWGIGMQSLVLSKVYPFDKFLVNGFPIIEWVETRNNGKQKRHRSLQQFQSYLGLSRRIEQSGDKESLRWFNSRVMRAHFYIWCMCRICPSPPRRLETEIGRKLGAKWDTMRQEKKAKGKDAIIRLTFYATHLLFNKLKHEIVF
ncbi:IS110 family transposase [Crocosphaera sp. Alani8]|uniref:IS110 family transposase n=1 Tax=Crocosphaera sp. Alani8 TaxID=3038952 RepID=UPI00313ECF20